jgi:mannosyl-3-phosphoglycerate phosphatase
LLDGTTYSYEAAIPALEALRALRIPLVLVSGNTRAEIEPVRHQLGHQDPFIVENGGAVFIPRGLFEFPLERARSKPSYDVIELGLPYGILRDVLKQIEKTVATPLRGFGDLSVEDIMQVTGLRRHEAILAKQREYDEPYLLEGPPALIEEVRRQIVIRGLQWIKGRRLYHLMGDNNKGQAATLLLRCYQRQQLVQGSTERIETVGIGDSITDASFLATVDHPILVQKPDGSYDPDVHIAGMTRAHGIGPVGWNHAVQALLATR